MMKSLLSLLACALAVTPAMSADPIGRLFFSPGERTALDKGRNERKAVAPAVRVEPAPSPAPGAQSVSYTGIVRRSDGRAMLWINNRIVNEEEALTGLNLRGHVRADGAVVLDVSDTGSTAEVKVGQSLDVRAGRVSEGTTLRDALGGQPVETRTPGDRGTNARQPHAFHRDGTRQSSD
jgi:hypothetical protein